MMITRTKAIVSLLLVFCLSFTVLISSVAQTDTVTIAAGESKRGKSSEVKADAQAEAWVKITGLSSGSSIKCYIWRLSAAAQVSGNPILNGLGEFTINYNNTGNKKKGDSYRAVFGKTTQSVGTAVNVSFEFWP